MREFQLLPERPQGGIDLGDWAIRLTVAVLFVMIGLDKFPSHRGSEWVRIFQQIGLGQWFRYFTGGVEVGGGLLVLVPRTALGGFVVLAATMLGAMLAHLVALHDGFLTVVPGIFFVVLAALAYHRWNR